jgi:arsenate reductase
MEKKNVLFVCSHNSARSQMAEAFLRHVAGDRFNVYSAGLESTEIHPMTRQVMSEAGFDLEGQRSKSLDEVRDIQFRWAIIVCAKADEQCPANYFNAIRLFWPFENPSAAEGTEAQRLMKFREVRDQIKEKLLAWLRNME